jgi:beta-N-acetylhexosaminidase
MTAHIRVPRLGDAPATLSREILDGLLRRELGFEGMVITDALEMRAVSGTVGSEEGAVLALAAGADALCLGHDLGPESVHRALVDAVRTGRLDEGRLREAAARVGEVSRWASRVATDRRESSEVGAAAARRALETYGRLALSRPALVVELCPEPSIAAGETGRGFGETLRSRLPGTEVIRLREAPDEARRVLDGHDGRQLVVALRDAHRHAWQRSTTQSLLSAASDAIVVETGLPHWRPDGAAGYVATHGAGRVNLDAAALALAGD